MFKSKPKLKKAPTKGAKQILKENKETIRFYTYMSLFAVITYNVVTPLLFFENMTQGIICLDLAVMGVFLFCRQTLVFFSKPSFSTDTPAQLLDPGVDLNMDGGLAEHVKDVIILCTITQLLAIYSNYFWLLLVLMPVRALGLLWTNILGPWFFQEVPLESELDEKKKRKMARKSNSSATGFRRRTEYES